MLLLDTNFLIALAAEEAERRAGPARTFLRAHPRTATIISLIAAAEFLEGAKDRLEGLRFVARYTVIGLSLAIAQRCAKLQSRAPRRLGENDAWLAATALVHRFTLVTSDGDFDRVPGLAVVDFTVR